ncbi:MAG: hypothetical protein LBS83_01040 [Holosporales bacterium]|nr:hypothetical protein [Holosporales bacterium]
MKTLYLIDVSGFIYRAYYALPAVTRTDGAPIGAVLGFCSMMLKLRERICQHSNNALWAGAFDVSRKNFRHEIDPSYKSNRKEVPEDLQHQFSIIRQATTAFNCPIIEKAGFEADDIIATYSKITKTKGIRIVIISSDKDLMQLYDENTLIFNPVKEKWVTENDILDKFGVHAEKVIEVQALAGDPSDGIIGIPGIGVKIAAELINKFGSLDLLLNNIHVIPQKKRRELLTKYANLAILAKKLVTLRSDIEIDFNEEKLEFPMKIDKETLSDFFEAQEFKNLLKRLNNLT